MSRERVETIFSWTIFPLVMASSLAVALWLMARGWNPAAAFIPAVSLAYVSAVIFERVFPFYSDWNVSRHDIRVDASHAIVSGLLVPELLRPAVTAGCIVLAGWLSESLGVGLWPTDWPLLAQLVLALVLGELPQYWWHRLEHETDLLWRFHAVHHSAPRLYWLNAARFHPIDLTVNQFLWYAPLVILGTPVEVIGLMALVGAVHGIYQHANLQVHCGPLNWFFSMAELHRWHHSTLIEESNRNFGQNLIVWDIVFGTRFLPKDRRPPEAIGIASMPNFPMTYLAQLATPFRWARTKQESA